MPGAEPGTPALPRSRGSLPAWTAWAALCAVLYVTLLPLRFDSISLADAWRIYRDMEIGAMRPGARQQWIANVVLFVPLGFCWMAWLAAGARGTAARVAVGAGVALLGLAVTASVEFAQVWIPRRTPSLIDMSGNFVGTLAGVLCWIAFAPRLPAWIARIRRGGMDRLLTVFAVAYVLAALVPFDFVLSLDEWRTKLAAGHLGWWSAPAGCGGGARCFVRDLLEVALAVPLGMWLSIRLTIHRRRPGEVPLPTRILLAAACGVGIELAQSLTLSGVAEGSAAALRGLGILLGFAWQARETNLVPVLHDMRRYGRAIVLVLAAPYLLLVFALDVGFGAIDADAARILGVLRETHFLPFYYHYLVSESAAIASVVQHALMYAPIGVAVWMWRGGGQSGRSEGRRAAVIAASTAALIETAKLLVPERHPDYTDVLIAAAAAAAAWALCAWGWRGLLSGAAPERDAAGGMSPAASPDPASVPNGAPPAAGRADDVPGARDAVLPAGRAPWAMRAAGAVLGIVVALKAATWPILPVCLLLGLVVYAWLLWRWREAWLLVIPALVPVLNLSHLSGRFVFDEFDLFVLATLAMAAWRWDARRGLPRLPRLPAWGLFAFTGVMAIGVLTALYPWRLPLAWDWTHYTSPYNALRAAKGFVWALLLFALLAQSEQAPARQLRRWLVPGMTLGLTLGLIIILRERLLYPGLFDFDSIYRISGAFADMHVGGPSIETWLVMTAGFALLWGWSGHTMRRLLPALALFVVALYALAVTYARAGYLGLAVWGCVAMLLVASRLSGRGGKRLRHLRLVAAIALLGAGALTVMFTLTGGFVDQRLAQARDDLEKRIDHWALARDLARVDGGMNWWGQGLGAFPRAYLLGNPAGRVPANFGVVTDGEGSRLRLGGGDSLYINQRIGLSRSTDYRLQLSARAPGNARLAVFVCEKHLRYSYGCRSSSFTVSGSNEPGAWQRFEWTFAMGGEDRPAGLRRGIALALAHQNGGGPIEISGIRVLDAHGAEYVRNGNFAQGMDHWYMSTDNLVPWRVENQWLEIWFDLGWIGLTAFVLLIAAATGHLAARALRGDQLAGFCLAAVVGVLAIGLFSTVFWSPRLMMLFFLLLLCPLARGKMKEER